MAVRFDTDGEDYTQATTFDIGTCTVCCWVRIDVDRNAVSTAWCIDNAASIALLLSTNADGVSWEIVDTGSGVSSLFAATVGTWYFIAVVKDPNASGTTAYWAAASAASLSSAVSSHNENASVNTIRVGESVNGGEWLNGSVAALKIWQGVKLTQGEIENERFQYVPNRTANLYAFYPFLEGGATAGARQDFSGAGNNLSAGTNSATTDGPPIAWRRGPARLFLPASAVGPLGGYYLNENAVDRYLMEDGLGLLLLEETVIGETFPGGYIKNWQNPLLRM
jgi:Concanavalin A-like lectin/glucanases superfamily